MATTRQLQRERQFGELLPRVHTLDGGILIGLDAHLIEVQARATQVLSAPQVITPVTTITGMAGGTVREILQRIGGAFAKLVISGSDVEILVNLTPADLPKYGTWLDLPMGVIMLQAAGMLPDLPEHIEGDFILMGELGIHGEIRGVPGAISLAYAANRTCGQPLCASGTNENRIVPRCGTPRWRGIGQPVRIFQRFPEESQIIWPLGASCL